MKPKEISIAKLHEAFVYSPETGRLFHRKAKGGGVRAGQPADSYIDPCGYVRVCIGGIKFQAHRVCYAMSHGVWPKIGIDHINRVKTDNRIVNLRVASHAENATNTGLRSDNTSGIKGVFWRASRKKWEAQIQVDGKTRNLGAYPDIETARLVRRIAEHCLFGGIHEFEDDGQQEGEAA